MYSIDLNKLTPSQIKDILPALVETTTSSLEPWPRPLATSHHAAGSHATLQSSQRTSVINIAKLDPSKVQKIAEGVSGRRKYKKTSTKVTEKQYEKILEILKSATVLNPFGNDEIRTLLQDLFGIVLASDVVAARMQQLLKKKLVEIASTRPHPHHPDLFSRLYVLRQKL